IPLREERAAPAEDPTPAPSERGALFAERDRGERDRYERREEEAEPREARHRLDSPRRREGGSGLFTHRQEDRDRDWRRREDDGDELDVPDFLR
ncbi:cell division protein FtsZ, partial [Corynebacterium mastitidis]